MEKGRERGNSVGLVSGSNIGYLLQQEEWHVAVRTLALRCHSLSGFLHRLGTQATAEGFAQLTGDRVERLFLAQALGKNGGHTFKYLVYTSNKEDFI